MDKNTPYHEDYHYYDIVRKNIRKYRKLANLTQQNLADMIDIEMNYISQIETGKPKKYFTLIIIGRIADVLNINITKLFEEDEQEKTTN